MYRNYIDSSIRQFLYYKKLGEKTFDQLSDEDLFHTPGPESNSVAVIVQHLWGNMMSRWTNLFGSDGEKDTRDRDAEFEATITSRKEMMEKWHEGWRCLLRALNDIEEYNFYRDLVYVRNIGHTVPEAINRQLCHYAYHVGQIVYIGKMLKGENWQSLSIPRGGTKAFNAAKFAKEKHKGHFTDGLLDENMPGS